MCCIRLKLQCYCSAVLQKSSIAENKTKIYYVLFHPWSITGEVTYWGWILCIFPNCVHLTSNSIWDPFRWNEKSKQKLLIIYRKLGNFWCKEKGCPRGILIFHRQLKILWFTYNVFISSRESPLSRVKIDDKTILTMKKLSCCISKCL